MPDTTLFRRLSTPITSLRSLREGPLPQRALRVARTAAGMAYAGVAYLVQRPHVTSQEHPWPPPVQPPRDRPLPGDAGRVQHRRDGVGPLCRRRYAARIVGSPLTPEQLTEAITADVNTLSPVEVAAFDAARGNDGRMAVGDEWVVRMPGPWNAPVRVVEREPCSFRFVTLDGHMEAGEITFRVGADGQALTFEIESWARSADLLFDTLYRHLRLARKMQEYMWVHVCERVAAVARGRLDGPVQVDTWTADLRAASDGTRR